MQQVRLALVWMVLSTGCICAPGQLACDSSCTDVSNDPLNCGACGRVCEYLCRAGTCVPRPECGPEAARPSCDDGDACNGVETCDLTVGRCDRGTPMRCRDDVSCTYDQCIDGACVFSPSDGMCEAGQYCDATLGCQRACPSPCDPVAPICGCSAFEGCYANEDEVTCSPEGNRAEGQTCGALNDCEAGTGCVGIPGTSVATCERYCRADTDCPRGACREGVVSARDPELGFCTRSCDLRSSAGCPAGTKCGLVGGGLTGCIAAGSGAVGSICTSHASCRSGLLCVGTTSGICREWCRIGHDEDCGSSFARCSGLSPAPSVDGVAYGYCR